MTAIPPNLRAELDAAIAESDRRVSALNSLSRDDYADAEERKQARLALAAAERTARLARASLTKLEHEASAAREGGHGMPLSFWNAFAAAVKTVRLAEHAVNKAREKCR